MSYPRRMGAIFPYTQADPWIGTGKYAITDRDFVMAAFGAVIGAVVMRIF